MKRKLFLTFIFYSLVLLLQARHLEFMGIPLDGSISSFHSKLIKKGLKVSKLNSEISNGARLYEGHFAGKEASVFVYYNVSTKKVWKCRVVINCEENRNMALNELYYFKELLKEKYEGQALDSEMLEDNDTIDPESFLLLVFEPPVHEGSFMMGTISLSIDDFEYYGTHSYSLFIDYEDADNSNYNKNNILDDL